MNVLGTKLMNIVNALGLSRAFSRGSLKRWVGVVKQHTYSFVVTSTKVVSLSFFCQPTMTFAKALFFVWVLVHAGTANGQGITCDWNSQYSGHNLHVIFQM